MEENTQYTNPASPPTSAGTSPAMSHAPSGTSSEASTLQSRMPLYHSGPSPVSPSPVSPSPVSPSPVSPSPVSPSPTSSTPPTPSDSIPAASDKEARGALPVFTDRGLTWEGCPKQSTQLNVFDYLADVPGNLDTTDLVEIQFKNTRKAFFHNTNHLPLEKGDIVAVEASPGHDIGTVTLTGNLVLLQMKRTPPRNPDDLKRIYRKARPLDMDKFEEAKAREHETMIRSRQIAKELGLEMKIGDVEFQGDGQKAIFYYIADGRVDFRQLIKVLAEEFRVRIEMKQIGARQEAGRIGGFGPCGRELCCTTWMRNFVSVSTAAARFQDLSLNPQKLAGQCAKLKCCMNYEADQYVEASRRLPSRELTLYTADSEYYFFKADILSGMVTYSTDRRMAANLVTISARRAFEVIGMNKEGEKPETLDNTAPSAPKGPVDLATQEELTRFDKSKKKKKKKKNAQQTTDAVPSTSPTDASPLSRMPLYNSGSTPSSSTPSSSPSPSPSSSPLSNTPQSTATPAPTSKPANQGNNANKGRNFDRHSSRNNPQAKPPQSSASNPSQPSASNSSQPPANNSSQPSTNNSSQPSVPKSAQQPTPKSTSPAPAPNSKE